MFGWFKRKNPFGLKDPRAITVAEATAQLLLLELMISQSLEDFPRHLSSPRVRGYLVGFFDAAAQVAGVRLAEDEQFCTYIGVGHMILLDGIIEDPPAFATASLLSQDMQFVEGQELGGREYFRWTENRDAPPIGLARLLHEARD